MPTMNLQVSAGGDDGYGFAGGAVFDNTGSTAFFGDDGDSSHAFFRFQLPDDLTGTIITSAILTGQLDGGPANCEVDVFADKSDNPNAPTNWSQLGGIPNTDASVFWNPSGDGGLQSPPDLVALIQELVDNFTLASGDHIIIVLDGDAYGTTAAREIHTFEDTGNEVTMVIEYESGAPATTTSVYDGNSFVPVQNKVWDGSNWATVITRAWDGSLWVPGGVAPPPPGGGLFSAPFMSYPSSAPISLDGVHGNSPSDPFIIEELSFEDVFRADGQPISLQNCSNILIRKIDTRKCTMGLLYAQGCNNITIQEARVENIAWEFRGQTLNVDWGNENDANFYQFDNCSGIRVSDIKGRYGNTEDVGSLFQSQDAIVERMHWQGAIQTDQPTSDGSESVMWTSDSNTGHILGDAGGSDLLVIDSTFLDAGQVLLQIAGGSDCTFQNCVGYGTGNTPQPWNVGAASICGTPPMTGHVYQGNRIQYWQADGTPNPQWFDPGCDQPADIDNVWGDDSLVRSDYIVDL